MRLGIVSDCIHYKTADGRVGTENHILLRQLEALASHFSSVTICCPFDKTDRSKVISFYGNRSITFEPVPLAGGDTLKDKLRIISILPKWLKGFKTVSVKSDIVYQRFPNNLNIPGFLYFYLNHKKVFGTYTGTWKNYGGEPATYRLQKWVLKNYFKGPVWIYTDKDENNARFHAGFSPSYSEAEWREEVTQVAERIQRIKKVGMDHFRLITVGTLIDYKNQLTILKACLILKQQNFSFHLTVVGDGPMRTTLEQFVNDHQLASEINLVGKTNWSELRGLYREHDFVVQAPLFEGFGKVPVEGFFHGCIPVINNISMAKQMTGEEERGFLFDAADPVNLATTLSAIKNKIHLLPGMIQNGRSYAQSQTLEAWANNYYQTVTRYFEKA